MLSTLPNEMYKKENSITNKNENKFMEWSTLLRLQNRKVSFYKMMLCGSFVPGQKWTFLLDYRVDNSNATDNIPRMKKKSFFPEILMYCMQKNSFPPKSLMYILIGFWEKWILFHSLNIIWCIWIGCQSPSNLIFFHCSLWYKLTICPSKWKTHERHTCPA